MKKLLIATILLLSTIFARAEEKAQIFSGCIKMNADGSETITLSMRDLVLTAPYTVDIWIRIAAGSTPASFLILSPSAFPSPFYPPSDAAFTYTIPASQALSLDKCWEVFLPPHDLNHPLLGDPFKLCPCMTDACYYKDPNDGDMKITFLSPAPGPNPLYVFLTDGVSMWGGMPISSPGIPHGLEYAHILDLTTVATGFTPQEGQCYDVWVSDIQHNGFGPTTPYYNSGDPNDPDHWATYFKLCPCGEDYYGGCLSTDMFGNQSLTVHTNTAVSPVYMWSAGYGPVTSSSVAPDGMGGSLVTFDLTAFGIGITAACHTFYFNTAPTNPAPGNAVDICPCKEPGQPPLRAEFEKGCMDLDFSGNELISIQTTNGTTTNYMWYGTLGPLAQSGVYPNPGPGLPYIATFNLSSFVPGLSLPFGGCYTFYFSNYVFSPAPGGGVTICSCGGGSGPSKPGVAVAETASSSLRVAPNPSNGTFVISGSLPSIKVSKQVTIEVVDMLGRVVYSGAADVVKGGINKQIKLGNEAANGVYTVRVKSDEVNEVLHISVGK